MLSIKLIGSSNQEVGYYADLSEDYYLDGTEAPGTWWGEGAKELGLCGTVSAEAFRRILLGRSLDGKSSLVQNAGRRNRRSAFDLTFTAPKSVSVARAVADEQQTKKIDQAFEVASRKAFEAVQELCGFSRRGSAGAVFERGRLVAATFRHETARGLEGNAPDPNLHYHFVLCNVCVREDGTTGTFDARFLFRRQMKLALGAMFRAELSKQLEQIGFNTFRPQNSNGRQASWFELEAIPSRVIKAFSKRREQIIEWLKANGQSGAKAAERAALATRNAKSKFSRENLSKAWQAVCKSLDFDPACIETEAREPMVSRSSPESVIRRGLEKAVNDRGHFTETDLLRYAAEEAQCNQISAKEVISTVREFLKNDSEIVRLQIDRGERRFTTVEILEIEKRLFEAASRSRENFEHVVSNELLASTLAKYNSLKPEQAEAVRHVTVQAGRIQCVNGMAGTGKTFMLGVAKSVWKAKGLQVIGTALASKAAQGLQEGSGIESTHVHRLLWEIEQGRRSLGERTVLVVDEAGMLGTRMMEQLVSLTEATNSKLVLVGDHRQLQAIDFGAPFRGLAEKIGVAELKEITRQRERWAKDAVSELADGKAESALERFAKRGLLSISMDRDQAISKLVDEWKKEYLKGTETKIFAGTRYETTAINRLCQKVLLESKKLSEEYIEVGAYKLRVGDSVVVTKNNAALLVKNGTEGKVVGIDRKRHELKLLVDSGLTVRINVELFSNISLGYATTTHKAQGQTVESAHVLVGGPMTDRELSYVQGSRAKGTTRFYTDTVNGGESIERLASQMARSRAKDLVHEYTIGGV